MSEQLRYEVSDKGLEIVTSKRVIDSVTSRRGAMLDEVRRAPNKKVSSSEGGVLHFDFDALGRGFNRTLHTERATQVFGIVQQFEQVAAQEGIQDPRLHMVHDGHYFDGFGVEIDRLEGSDVVATTTLTNRLRQAARLLRWRDSLFEAKKTVRATVDTQEGIAIFLHPEAAPALATPDGYDPTSERITLYADNPAFRQEESFARLVAFTGLVGALQDMNRS